MLGPYLGVATWFAAGLCLLGATSPPPNLGGVDVRFEEQEGRAAIAAHTIAPYKIRIAVAPSGKQDPLDIRVELPITGRDAWPAADVEVRDVQGRAMPVRRNGIEWHKLLVTVPPVEQSYFVQAVEPPGGPPALPPERERLLADTASGLRVSIARWHSGHHAALSIRFDDSHPTHLTTAIPLLRAYGFRGTFMINPGGREPNSRRRSAFQDHRAEWEACAQRGDQEFANHTAHHRGAAGDAGMEAEIAEAAEAIWRLSPGKSKLCALNLGGGTTWTTTRTLRYYLDKYHLFDASQNSMGMDDTYGNRVPAFRKALGQHLERGLWLRIHYHSIGPGLSSSKANFRAVLDIAKEHKASLWIAGMADIHKYQTERNAAALSLVKSGPDQLTFKVKCLTDLALYDQPLTIEVTAPSLSTSEQASVTDAAGKAIVTRLAQADGRAMLQFQVPPHTEAYTVALNP